jgi:hypothetical protein
MKTCAVGIFILSMLPGLVNAQDLTEEGWFCGTREVLFDYQVTRSGVRINNFNIGERQSFMAKGTTVLEVSFSVANRSQKSVPINAQFAGFDGSGKLVFAAKAAPMMDMVSAGKTEEAKGDVYVKPGDLSRVVTICTKLAGDF